MTPKNYNSLFFEQHQYPSYKSALETLPIVLKKFQPSSALDIGCGTGAWLRAFNELTGVSDYLGVDGPYVNKSSLLIEEGKFVEADLNEKLQLDRKFDILFCLEVAEHLKQEFATDLVEKVTQFSDVILFSAALPGQEGTLHFNEQYPEYWAEKFETSGFKCLDFIRQEIWNNNLISFWYRQNILLFVKTNIIQENAELEALSKLVDVRKLTKIHPELWDYKVKKCNYFETLVSSWSNFLRYKLFSKRLYEKI